MPATTRRSRGTGDEISSAPDDDIDRTSPTLVRSSVPKSPGALSALLMAVGIISSPKDDKTLESDDEDVLGLVPSELESALQRVDLAYVPSQRNAVQERSAGRHARKGSMRSAFMAWVMCEPDDSSGSSVVADARCVAQWQGINEYFIQATTRSHFPCK